MPLRLSLAAFGLVAFGAISPAQAACEPGRAGATIVSEAYPSADALPENLLRFYIYFSAPMRRDGIADAVVLENADGAPVAGVFLENRRDLWSPDARRLTLILDPGRVKTGLAAHDAMGRALEPGRRYALVVAADALDAAGCRLAADFRKPFHVIEADLAPPDLDQWRMTPPASGTRAPLELRLNGAHDHVSLAYRLRVRDAAGAAVPGSIALAEGETVWRFTPRAPWTDAPHTLAVDPALEDVAGNRLTGLFDQPIATARDADAPFALAFTPSHQSEGDTP